MCVFLLLALSFHGHIEPSDSEVNFLYSFPQNQQRFIQSHIIESLVQVLLLLAKAFLSQASSAKLGSKGRRDQDQAGTNN